jgi:hypothetical protein
VDIASDLCYNIHWTAVISSSTNGRKAMSITPTRRVSSGQSVKPVSRGAKGSSEGGGFVEAIDTSNRVAVQSELEDERRRKNRKFDEENADNEISAGEAYVQGAIEALSASGVYEEEEEITYKHTSSKIGVYGNNQSIIQRDIEKDRGFVNEAREFYESAPLPDDFDELV